MGAAGSGDQKMPATGARRDRGAVHGAVRRPRPRSSPTSRRPSWVGRKNEVDTPALLLDLDKFERNATKISSFLQRARRRLAARTARPTSRRRSRAGRWSSARYGIICAKSSEAQVLVDYGIPSASSSRTSRAAARSSIGSPRSTVGPRSSPAPTTRSTSRWRPPPASRRAQDIPMLVSIDVGMDRTGALPGQPTLGPRPPDLQDEGRAVQGRHGLRGPPADGLAARGEGPPEPRGDGPDDRHGPPDRARRHPGRDRERRRLRHVHDQRHGRRA